MKKGQTAEGVVEALEFPDRGVLSADGEKITIKNALPGQRVRFAVTKKRGKKAEGKLLTVLEPSPLERPETACPHAGVCGGCLYQGFPYAEQLKIKERQVKDLLSPACGPDGFGFEGILESPVQEGYRNKMEFSFGDSFKGGPLALGMHRRGSFYDIVDTPFCRIVHQDFREILKATRAFFADRGIGYYKKNTHTGYLRHLLVRRAAKTGEILVALVTSGQRETLPGAAGIGGPSCPKAEAALLADWTSLLCGLETGGMLTGRIAGILHIRNDRLADIVASDETEVLYGQDFFYEELLGLRFKITPFSFFQTNSLGAEVLYDTARRYVGETKDKVIFDLYSGTGTISQILAPVAAHVVGVEIAQEAVAAARTNAVENGLTNCEFLAGDVLKVIDSIARKPDLVILDPPRDGIHPKALEKIIAFQTEHILYISCKPASLARDLPAFLAAGYRVEKSCCVDMFPQTANVETVVLMSIKDRKPDTHINVSLDMDDYHRIIGDEEEPEA